MYVQFVHTAGPKNFQSLFSLLMVVEEVSETWKWKRLIEFMSTTLDLEEKVFLL